MSLSGKAAENPPGGFQLKLFQSGVCPADLSIHNRRNMTNCKVLLTDFLKKFRPGRCGCPKYSKVVDEGEEIISTDKKSEEENSSNKVEQCFLVRDDQLVGKYGKMFFIEANDGFL